MLSNAVVSLEAVLELEVLCKEHTAHASFEANKKLAGI